MYSLFIWNSNVTGGSAFHLAALFLCQVHFLLIWPILNPIRLWGLGKALGNGGFRKKKKKSFHQAKFTLVLLEFQAYLEPCLVLHALGQKWLCEHKCRGWSPPHPPGTEWKLKCFEWVERGCCLKGGCQGPASFFHINWDTSMISF